MPHDQVGNEGDLMEEKAVKRGLERRVDERRQTSDSSSVSDEPW